MLRSKNRQALAACLCLTSASALLIGQAGAEENQKRAELPPIVVSATATERALADAPASVTVVSGEELREKPVLDLTDALRGTPGVTINSVGLGRRGISIRGMPEDFTLVLVDGKRVNAASNAIAHADFDLGWVPAEAIERIEVVRGPMSSLYGSEALGGVVNIITRAATNHWQGSATVRGGIQQGHGGNEYQTGIYAGGPIVPGKLGVSFYGELQGRDETPSANNPNVSELEERESQSGNLAFTITPDDAQRIDLSYMYGEDTRTRNVLPGGPMPVPYTSTDDIRRQHVSLSHTGKWGWGETRIRAYRSQLDRENKRSSGTPTGDQKLVDDVIDGHVSVPLFGAHVLTTGGEWRKEKLNDQTVNAQGKDDAEHFAWFIQDEWQILSNLSFVIGNRSDRHQEFGWEHSPRAYLVYHPVEDWTLKGGAGKGFKAPTLKQLSPGYSAVGGGGRFTIVGNPDLKPETSTSYEVGAEYNPGMWNIGATVFQNDLKDLIQTNCTAFCGMFGAEQRTYENVDKARIRGIEAGAGVTLPFDLRLDANYTRLDAKDRESGQELTERPRHQANMTLAWFPMTDFMAQLRGEYVGRQTVASGPNRVSLNPYSIWSIDLAYDVTDQATLRAGLENIFDERLAEKSQDYPYTERRRMIWAGIGYKF